MKKVNSLKDGDPFQQVRKQIRRHGYPKILCIGSSHVTHWARYKKDRNISDEEHDLIANFYLMGVGGAKLIDIIDLLSGKNFPPHKKHLKNQWKILQDNEFKAS